MAVLTTYKRRGSRLTAEQEAAWDRRRDAWWIPDESADEPAFDLERYFGRRAPLIVEIGCGIGEATGVLAAARPDCDVLAFEVWRPGVAETFRNLERAGAENVRVMSVDAVWSLEHLLGPDSVAELWTFFPDPWPKQRHHRRRLVSAEFAALAGSRVAPGGLWRLATDWPEYAEQIGSVLASSPWWQPLHDHPAPRWEERPLTRFERRGIRAGRPITDFTVRRR